MHTVNTLEEHILRVLVGDVANHESRASVFTVQNAMKVDDELRIVVLSALLARSMLLL